MDTIKQPRINIAMVGHVSHGKTTIIKALTGIETTRHSREKERGITIKIGYANCKIFKCPVCPEPQCYHARCHEKNFKCGCGADCELVQYLSFVDCPGHESLMSTMLSGATIMDYAILLIDGSQKCPQPQTIEHLLALEILQVSKIIIIQNKLDLIDGNQAMDNYKQIREFVKGTCAENAPIIPMSAQKKYNLDILCEYLYKYFEPVPQKNYPVKMNVIRSFDINRPGCDVADIKGGVLGGSVISGVLKTGDKIELRPGIVKRNTDGIMSWTPITTTIVSMKSDDDTLETAGSGGLIGICTNLDPAFCRSDRMAGQVVGIPGTLPDIYTDIIADCKFVKRVDKKINQPKKDAFLQLNIASRSVPAQVMAVDKNRYHLQLKYPCCMDQNEKFSISAQIDGAWRLIGIGILCPKN